MQKLHIVLLSIYCVITPYAWSMDEQVLCKMPSKETLRTRVAYCFKAEIVVRNFDVHQFQERLATCDELQQLVQKQLPATKVAESCEGIIAAFYDYLVSRGKVDNATDRQKYQNKYRSDVLAVLLADYPGELRKLQKAMLQKQKK